MIYQQEGGKLMVITGDRSFYNNLTVDNILMGHTKLNEKEVKLLVDCILNCDTNGNYQQTTVNSEQANLFAVTQSLMKSVITVNYTAAITLTYQIFDSVIWNNNTAIIQLSDILLYFLDELRRLHKKFTLDLLFSFATPYSPLLYCWLQPLATNSGTSVDIDVEQLRKLLHCDNRYLIFRDFRKFVLEKATAEINQTTELTVNYTFEKIVTKVIKIKFSVILTPKTA